MLLNTTSHKDNSADNLDFCILQYWSYAFTQFYNIRITTHLFAGGARAGPSFLLVVTLPSSDVRLASLDESLVESEPEELAELPSEWLADDSLALPLTNIIKVN